DEKVIASVMETASLVFVPGASGLSINHAFAYGRPYFTLQSVLHGPEIDYIRPGENGAVLGHCFEDNVRFLATFMLDRERLVRFCRVAEECGKALSVERWAVQMRAALSDA